MTGNDEVLAGEEIECFFRAKIEPQRDIVT